MNQLKATIATTALALLLALPGSALARQDKKIKMTFEIVDGELVLKNEPRYTTPSNCRSDNHPGCYDFGGDEIGKFRLTLHRGNADCDADDDWKFHSVVLGGETDVERPGPKPTTWGAISADAARDFDADETTGAINLVADGRKRVTFEDQNNHSFSIWYKVGVERCGDGEVLEYDPRVDNRGLPEN